MPDDESAVATIAAEPPTINFKPESFSIDWEPEQETPVETEPTAPAPTEPDPVPEPESATPDASTEEPPPTPATDWAALTADLTKEQMDDLVKSNPALKRRLDGELGSRLQAREKQIREEAAAAALLDYNSQVKLVNTAIARYEEIEALQDTDPDTYERDWASNTEYKKWVADLYQKRDQVVAMGEVKQAATPPADATAAVNAALNNFHTLAIPEAIDTIRAEAGELYAALPAESRKAIEGAKFDSEESWLQVILANFVKGTKTAQEKTIKAAVAAAREAGRKEALAEFSEDRPVIPNTPNTTKLSADDVIREHGNNGFANITREQLEAAKAQKGLIY